MDVIIGKNIFFDIVEGKIRIIDFCKKDNKFVVTTDDGKSYSFDKKFLADFESGELVNKRFMLLIKTVRLKEFLRFKPVLKIEKEENISNWEL